MNVCGSGYNVFLRMDGIRCRTRREKHMSDSQTTHTQQKAPGRRGLFITIEGGDGAGKSTQAALLADHLERRGCTVRRIHEPGGTELGERIRAVLLDATVSEVDSLAELLLYEAARAQLVSEVIVPALDAGEVVVCDRFADSTLAYQGFGRQLDVALVGRLNDIAAQGAVPDRTVLLMLDAEDGLARATSGAQGADRMEQAGTAFHHRVCDGFRQLASSCPERMRVVDAQGTPEQVHEAVLAALEDMLPQTPDAGGKTGGCR